jgi:hypothetical protein
MGLASFNRARALETIKKMKEAEPKAVAVEEPKEAPKPKAKEKKD